MKFQLTEPHKQLIAERASAMRHTLTPTESILWNAIRNKQLGALFKRLHQLPLVLEQIRMAIK